jgi:hypothetical protein
MGGGAFSGTGKLFLRRLRLAVDGKAQAIARGPPNRSLSGSVLRSRLRPAAAFPVGEEESGHDRAIRVSFATGDATERSLDFVTASIEGSKTGLNRF